jgi:hypothetical protein
MHYSLHTTTPYTKDVERVARTLSMQEEEEEEIIA